MMGYFVAGRYLSSPLVEADYRGWLRTSFIYRVIILFSLVFGFCKFLSFEFCRWDFNVIVKFLSIFPSFLFFGFLLKNFVKYFISGLVRV